MNTGDNLTTIDDLNLNVNISGLPFVNNTYDTKTNTNINKALCGTFNLENDNVTNFNFSSPICLTFSKNQNMCDIKIELSRMLDDKIPNIKVPINAMFCFDIYGVEKTINNRINYLS